VPAISLDTAEYVLALGSEAILIRGSASGKLLDIGPAAVPVLIETLKSRVMRARLTAGELLARFGASASPARDALIVALRDDSRAVRTQAARALGRTGPPSASAVGALGEMLTDPDPAMRCAALRALEDIGPDAVAVLPQILAALSDVSPDVREGALRVVARIGPPAKMAAAWIEAMPGAKSARLDVAAAVALYRVNSTPVSRLIEVLDGPDEGLAEAAVIAMGEMGADARTAVPALIAAVRRRRPFWKAMEALGKIGRPAGPAIPVLVDLLDDPSSYERQRAVNALGNIGVATPECLAAILRLLKSDRENRVRRECVVALGKIGPGAPEVVPALIDVLRGYSFRAAADALAGMGQAAQPALAEALRDDRPRTVLHALYTLMRCGPGAETIPALIELLQHEDRTLVSHAVELLESAGPDARAAVPALQELAKRESYIGRSARKALKAILRASDD
jgi:HEAT repeat protein